MATNGLRGARRKWEVRGAVDGLVCAVDHFPCSFLPLSTVLTECGYIVIGRVFQGVGCHECIC